MPDGGGPAQGAAERRLVFRGVTALARAFRGLQDAGCGCEITAAPPEGSPCGLALAVAAADLAAALAVLDALGVVPQGIHPAGPGGLPGDGGGGRPAARAR